MYIQNTSRFIFIFCTHMINLLLYRYDELAAVFGWEFVEKLGELKYFMVGCGALGCEFMKNFALNNICCGPGGKLIVTDADRIELSNLSRQFLFREHNVGQPKSKAAGLMATVMNEGFNVEALEFFVGPKTEDTFNDDFWNDLDGVCNALDNMEARQYVDVQCVKYEKSLLESGTMGTSGNVDTICPFKTRTYRDGGNAAEGGGVPMCTLRNFPHLTDHCIEWARDQFELVFKKLGKSCETYLANPAAFEIDKHAKAGTESGLAIFDIRSVTSMFRAAANPSMGTIAQLSFDLFHFMFRDRILDLQSAFPADKRMVDKDTGADKGPFWGEKKRYPTSVVYNPNDESHTSFLLSTTCLLAVALGLITAKAEDDDTWLQEYRGCEFIANLSSGLTPPLYMQAPVTSPDIEQDVLNPKESLDTLLAALFLDLKDAASKVTTLTFNPSDFEKDDDLNFHIAFVTATANLRCDNYTITRTDFHACKVIAGKIIAAIATTTAAVCGLVILELFKLVQKKGTVAYMNRAIGLAVNSYTSFTAEEPIKFKTYTERSTPTSDELPADAFDEKGVVKEEYIEKTVKHAYPENHSVWDKLTCPGTYTLKEFAEWLKNEHKLKLLSWDFIYGHKSVTDEENKSTNVSVSSPVYPPKPILDYTLIPSLELTMPQATQAIMRTPLAKPTQQYIALWKEFKALGSIPVNVGLVKDAKTISENSTLCEILEIMSILAEEAEASKVFML
jgi:ubiquitin-activating enzyme E1